MRRHFKHRSRDSFTLLELMLAVAIIGVVAAIVITAINPQAQFNKAQDIKRLSDSNQLQKALGQYLVDSGTTPDPTKFASGTSSSPMPICSPSAVDKNVCIDAAALVGKYVAAIPVDPTEACGGVTGYGVYRDSMGPHVVQQHDKDLTTCPVSIDWTDTANGKVLTGTATLGGSLDLTGKTLQISNGATLNLNGNNVTGNPITNNGTVVAKGTETVTANGAAGAWKINGPSNSMNVLANQTNITSLTLDPSSAATYTPASALNVTGNLAVGSNATFDTTSASNTAVGSVLNNGTIVLGNNANTITFGSFDSVNGNTSIVGSLIRSGLTYHDLTINSTNAILSGTTTVNGALTVKSGKALAMNGNTLVTSGNVSVIGSLSGQGSINLGNGGNSVTVANGAVLAGTDATHRLAISAANAWSLQYGGSSPFVLSNLALTNASANPVAYCTHNCLDSGGNGNVTFTSSTATWNGSYNTNWFNPANWSGNQLPSIESNVVIPSGLTNYPVVKYAASLVNTITQNGGTLICGGANGALNYDGGYVCNGGTAYMGNSNCLSMGQSFAVNAGCTLSFSAGNYPIDCPITKYWNGASCVALPGCTVDANCPTGFVCNASTCKNPCMIDSDCPANQVCSTGYCDAPTFTWTGAASTDWLTAGNWQGGSLPTSYANVVIPVGAARYPSITASNATHYHNVKFMGGTSTCSGNGALIYDTLFLCGSAQYNAGGGFCMQGGGLQIGGC